MWLRAKEKNIISVLWTKCIVQTRKNLALTNAPEHILAMLFLQLADCKKKTPSVEKPAVGSSICNGENIA